jgi:hypothetical protein
MTKEQIKFITDTLESAIEWSQYASPYFQEKYNLAKDKEDALKVIEMLSSAENQKCTNCKHCDEVNERLIHCSYFEQYMPTEIGKCDMWEGKE